MQHKYLSKHMADSEILALCSRNGYFVKNGIVKNILGADFSERFDDRVGVGLIGEEGELLGFIGSLSYRYEGSSIIHLSSGLIDESLRGKGFAKAFFSFAYTLGDMVLDLSPTEQVYHMLKKHISGIRDITDYQIWIKPKKRPTTLNSSWDLNAILEGVEGDRKRYYLDNAKYNICFLRVSDGANDAIVGYYTFSRYFVKGFEIVFCDDHKFLAKHFEDIVSVINKKEKAFVCFCDHWLIGEKQFEGEIDSFAVNNRKYVKRIIRLFFSKKGYIKTANRRLVWRKTDSFDLPPLDYLYSEMIFYKSKI